MNKPQPPTVPKAEIEEVLSSVFIRRRRKDIAELYGDTAAIDGKAVRVPGSVAGQRVLPAGQGVCEGRLA